MMFRSLRLFNYRTWFTGALISNIGAWMQSTALSWTVLTVLTNNDATAVGINMALQFGAALLPAGVTALVMLTEVLFATVSALWLGGGSLTPQMALGGGLIILAALLATRRPGKDA